MDNIVGSNETVWCEVCRKMHEPWEHMCNPRNAKDRIEALEKRIAELEKENARFLDAITAHLFDGADVITDEMRAQVRAFVLSDKYQKMFGAGGD